MSGGAADSPDTPSGWKYLPTLALPDGSHNYDKDTVFFHLPSLVSADETVFGISCFRQIPVEKLKVRTPDMTRGTVQKAVCVLSTVPLYGQIQVPMPIRLGREIDSDNNSGSMTQFFGRNRRKIENCWFFYGLSARELILALRHKVLLLYKLLLLEKKVLFFQSPVHPLCSSILSLLSLHPGMIEKGLSQSACFKFGEYLDRRTRTTDDAYTDGVGWEGGGEWIRTQFHAYTLALLRTSILPEGSKEMDQFNRWYMSAFMETKSYKRWRSHPDHRNILEAVPGHPFAGQLSVADMKLRISHTMQTTEGGRKLNQAMASTGRVVATTGRAVGGALSQAKGAFSSWWSNLTTSPTLAQAADTNADEAEVADAPDDEAISDFAPPRQIGIGFCRWQDRRTGCGRAQL
ncbi:unnamed protein product [Nesidiocoris tenuis]|uniref:AVL9/DENND6 domain-containing protein n=1 Tax=Nesidiocoris tenuis TaxID=355587 RepID=A0A6H5GKJ2_9HEMI|nr:unnamed protein product [Nesidiocoris tenuis]